MPDSSSQSALPFACKESFLSSLMVNMTEINTLVLMKIPDLGEIYGFDQSTAELLVVRASGFPDSIGLKYYFTFDSVEKMLYESPEDLFTPFALAAKERMDVWIQIRRHSDMSFSADGAAFSGAVKSAANDFSLPWSVGRFACASIH